MKTIMLTAMTSFLMAVLPATIKAQENSGSLARLIRYEVKAAYQVSFRNTVTAYINYSMKQESNILSEAFYEEQNPSILWIIERWNNTIIAEAISNSPTFIAMQTHYEKVAARPVKIIEVTDLEPLPKMQWRTAADKKDKPIIIMLFVDCRHGTEEEFKKVYHRAMPEFRGEAGVINYQLSQLQTDSTQFVTYEKFRNEEAFRYHLNFPPIQPVLQYLETSIKQQPFQTGLHRLIPFATLSSE